MKFERLSQAASLQIRCRAVMVAPQMPHAPMPRFLMLLLCLANLVIGTGAFMVTSVLPQVAQALQVSLPVAGQAMSVYALSTALLAPLVLVATGRWPRRHALVFAMLLYAAGNVVCAMADSFLVLLLGRVLMGLGAVFTPLAAGIVVAMVPPAQRGRALALVFLGMSLSYVVGLPLGNWLATIGGWHLPIAAVAVAALLMSALLWGWVPRDVAAPGGSLGGLAQVLKRGDVWAVLGVTLLALTAIFVVFSFVVPVLQELVAMSPGKMALTLMLFGLSGVAGTLLGGAANDRIGPQRTLTMQLTGLALMMLLLPLTAGSWPWMMGVMLLWGTAGFGMMAPQQSRLATLAAAQAPLLLSLNSSMLYVGTALGALLGGLAAPWMGFDHLSWASAPLALLALGLLWLGPARARRKATVSA